MQSVFERPNVLRAMENENKKQAEVSFIQFIQIEEEKHNQEEKLAKKLFSSESQSLLENTKLVNDEITNQKELIEGRIKRRKKLKEINSSFPFAKVKFRIK